MTKTTIGVIGAAGDLGSQLMTRLHDHGLATTASDPAIANSPTIEQLATDCAIIHVCAPLSAIADLNQLPPDSLLVLHDSVMASSFEAIKPRLQSQTAVVHMLMNEQATVVVAQDGACVPQAIAHLTQLGLNPVVMPSHEHDILIARSQAPLALLSQVLLPYLYEQRDAGMLTPSGQLLVETLHSRSLVWTPATIHSILRNPQLRHLVDDMQSIITKVGYNEDNE